MRSRRGPTLNLLANDQHRPRMPQPSLLEMIAHAQNQDREPPDYRVHSKLDPFSLSARTALGMFQEPNSIIPTVSLTLMVGIWVKTLRHKINRTTIYHKESNNQLSGHLCINRIHKVPDTIKPWPVEQSDIRIWDRFRQGRPIGAVGWITLRPHTKVKRLAFQCIEQTYQRQVVLRSSIHLQSLLRDSFLHQSANTREVKCKYQGRPCMEWGKCNSKVNILVVVRICNRKIWQHKRHISILLVAIQVQISSMEISRTCHRRMPTQALQTIHRGKHRRGHRATMGTHISTVDMKGSRRIDSPFLASDCELFSILAFSRLTIHSSQVPARPTFDDYFLLLKPVGHPRRLIAPAKLRTPLGRSPPLCTALS